MNILVVGSFCYDIYAPAFYNAWKQQGHDVHFVDCNSYKNKGFFSHFRDKVQAKFHIGVPLIKLNKVILKEVEDFKPDFVFFYYCLDVFTSTYRKLKESGVCFFTYMNDDPFSRILLKPWCRRFHRSLPLADWNFVYRFKNIDDYKGIGVNNVSVLMPYFMHEDNFPMDIERNIPIAFMGHWENDGRDEYVRALLDAKVPLTIYGDEATWSMSPLYARLKEEHILVPRKGGKEYNQTINQLLVDIVFLSKMNHDTYTRRCFEIPVTKTCMLCEYTDDMNRLFPENECAVYFRSPSDFAEKAKWLLEHPKECRRIGENSFLRLKEIGGSEIDRSKEIINKYLELKMNS